jgi:hypothetical protein
LPFKPNYGAKRADRDRAQRSRHEEKLKERQERSLRRKAEREGVSPDGAENEKPTE